MEDLTMYLWNAIKRAGKIEDKELREEMLNELGNAVKEIELTPANWEEIIDKLDQLSADVVEAWSHHID